MRRYTRAGTEASPATSKLATSGSVAVPLEPILDIAAIRPSSTNEQFIGSLCNFVFSGWTVILCNYCLLILLDATLDGFSFSFCL